MKLRYIFMPFLAFLLMSHNAFAVELTPAVRYKTGYVMPYWSDNHNRAYATGGYNYSTNGDHENADILYFKSGSNTNISVAVGNYVSLTGDISITVSSSSQAVSIQANPRQYFVIGTSNVDCPVLSFDETSFQQATTNSSSVWVLRYTFSSICRLRSSVSQNVAMNISLRAPSASGTDTLRFVPTYLGIWEPVEGYDDSAVIEAIDNLNTTIQGLIEATGDIADAISEQNDKEEEAVDNISDQTPEDISSSGSTENSETSSIIGVFSSFLSSLTNVQATTCIITLPFPSFAGGSWTWNICQNRDKAGNIMALFGSATLILFYVPVAWRLLAMIYNEIRSFTNG